MTDQPAHTPGHWPQGDAEIDTMLEHGDLERVTPSAEHANLLMSHADGHLEAAEPLIDVHPTSAFPLIYDATRKAMTAILAKQGVRPYARSELGAHKAVQQAIQAQLGRAAGVVRPFGPMRLRRHDTEYPSLDDVPLTSGETRQAFDDATSIVAAMKKLLPRLGPF
ncbi:hypothetical protein [Nocardioides sp.]|uniref:hypothetical protein n=1 Tax=Nocardioides sp. TaxID=35761 RepID=UPI0019B704B6|nr:hypothetical protein [Nocardioides sp.]MBC7277387.1 hypothetical protein [Nocardioides sp.]